LLGFSVTFPEHDKDTPIKQFKQKRRVTRSPILIFFQADFGSLSGIKVRPNREVTRSDGLISHRDESFKH